jgi:CBS domain-containing protein
MYDLLRAVRRPAISSHRGATVQEACETMVAAGVGALVVLDDGRLVGIVSERDVVARVVVRGLDPRKTLVGQVMTRDVRTAGTEVTIGQALEIMEAGGFRHLPLIDAARRPVGVVSVRDLLRQRVEELDQTSESVIDYLGADGPGG